MLGSSFISEGHVFTFFIRRIESSTGSWFLRFPSLIDGVASVYLLKVFITVRILVDILSQSVLNHSRYVGREIITLFFAIFCNMESRGGLLIAVPQTGPWVFKLCKLFNLILYLHNFVL